MTTAVCFDLDGTLVRYDRPFDEITAASLESALGASTDAAVEAYEAAFLSAFEALEPDPYHVGMRAVLDHARTAPAVPDEAVATADVDQLVRAHRDAELAATYVPDAVRDCLDALRADDETRLAVVSDGVGAVQREKLRRHDLADGFATTVVSYDVGGHKAAGTPYAAVRERLAADEYVMVGDDYAADVEAARAAGFVPVHYEDDDADLFEILRALL